jgi:hypothetical protein
MPEAVVDLNQAAFRFAMPRDIHVQSAWSGTRNRASCNAFAFCSPHPKGDDKHLN